MSYLKAALCIAHCYSRITIHGSKIKITSKPLNTQIDNLKPKNSLKTTTFSSELNLPHSSLKNRNPNQNAETNKPPKDEQKPLPTDLDKRNEPFHNVMLLHLRANLA